MTTERAIPAETVLLTAIADEMRAIRALVEQIATPLVADARFVAEHLEQLQNFDLIVQCAEESADVLDRLAAGLSGEDAIALVRLTAIQQRLGAAIAKD